MSNAGARWAEAIGDALLHEGYLLYPYRSSALKNRYRWQFGVVAPLGYHRAGGGEPWRTQTECLVEPGAAPVLDLKIRFLQIEARQVEVWSAGRWIPADRFRAGDRELVTWEEGESRAIEIAGLRLRDLQRNECRRMRIAGGRSVETVKGSDGSRLARIVRKRWPISCAVEVRVETVGPMLKLAVTLENRTRWPRGAGDDRSEAMRRSLIGAHTLLTIEEGAFVSLLDPPQHAAGAAASCRNLHTWPVLVGDPSRRDAMLSSPIIVYDYPAVAPESPGDFFDATEIDELLTLRVMTLTEDERRQAAATDPRAADLIERARSLAPEQLERLHGAVRHPDRSAEAPPQPADWEAWLNPPAGDQVEARDAKGRPIRVGDAVRLRPVRPADAMDMFLNERTARVAAVHQDLEDQAHVAVTIDGSMSEDLHAWNGRFYYFRPDEVEVFGTPTPAESAGGAARVLVAGIGNVFLGDDGFGSAVAQRLAAHPLPRWVRVEDFGIRSVHLAYDLLERAYDATILVDATPRGGEPGTLYLLEPEGEGFTHGLPDAHAFGVESVLALLQETGSHPGRVYLVGCEPLTLDPEMGLSPPVARAVDEAVAMVAELVARLER